MSGGSALPLVDADQGPPTGMAALLPAQVRVVETTADAAPEEVLFPAEAAHIARAVPRRRAEFATVRHCARQALAALGVAPQPILPGPDRAPVWPPGIIGALTHCEGYRAAAVAFARDASGANTAGLPGAAGDGATGPRAEPHGSHPDSVSGVRRPASIGIDAEIHEPLPEGVVDLVTAGDEPSMLADLARESPGIAWDRLLFSAKESIFKTWHPLMHAWLDFTECELSLEPGAAGPGGTFTGRLLVPGPVVAGRSARAIGGRWTLSGRHVLTAAWI